MRLRPFIPSGQDGLPINGYNSFDLPCNCFCPTKKTSWNRTGSIIWNTRLILVMKYNIADFISTA